MMTEALFHLIVVLVLIPLIVLSVWLLKRFYPQVSKGRLPMRLSGQVSLGGRERVVGLEVGAKTLILGVTSQNINLLASIDTESRDILLNEQD